jgi:hypothetical protein
MTEERVDEDIKWMLLPNGRGDPQLAIISGLEKNSAAEPLVENIKFYLYTRYLIQLYIYFLICSVSIYHYYFRV